MQLALVSLDKGPGAEQGADLGNYVPLPSLLSAIPGTAPALVAAYANDTAGVGKASGPLPLRLFSAGVNPKEAVEGARGAGRAQPCLLVQHGRLFGAGNMAAVGAVQPLPFVGGPLQKPVVEESYLKQNMLLALGSSLARSPAATTLRLTLAQAMVRSAGRVSAIKDFSVLSLEGGAPSASDWEQQLAGLDTRGGVTVFEKALGPKERVDLPMLQDWLMNDFGAGLSTLAISRVLSSPKPSMYVCAPGHGHGPGDGRGHGLGTSLIQLPCPTSSDLGPPHPSLPTSLPAPPTTTAWPARPRGATSCGSSSPRTSRCRSRAAGASSSTPRPPRSSAFNVCCCVLPVVG